VVGIAGGLAGAVCAAEARLLQCCVVCVMRSVVVIEIPQGKTHHSASAVVTGAHLAQFVAGSRDDASASCRKVQDGKDTFSARAVQHRTAGMQPGTCSKRMGLMVVDH